jgi:hypothetical protein
MTKNEVLEIIKESSSTYLLGVLIHGNLPKELKNEVVKELKNRGSFI